MPRASSGVFRRLCRVAAIRLVAVLAIGGGTLVASPAWAGGSGIVSVDAVVLSKSNCRFDNSGATLAFGSVNPASTTAATAVTTTTFKCAGSAPTASYAISHDSGLHETAPDANRMQSTTTPSAFLSYSLALSPSSGSAAKNATVTFTITGSIPVSAFQDAAVGSYADTVTLTIVP